MAASAKVHVTPQVIGRLRLASQGLQDGFGSVAECVSKMGAMQAQDLASAFWAVGQRVPGSGLSDVLEALENGTVVRSWPMRGTLHLVPPGELRWILAITTERAMRSATARHRDLGIDAADIAICRELALGHVAGTPGATREELFKVFEGAGQGTKAQRGIHLLWILCQHGWLVQGPPAGTAGRALGQQLFVAFDEWIPESRTLDRDEGIAEFLLRYLRSHGPATERDFSWWSQIPLAEVRKALAAVSGQLVELVFRDTSYWLSPEAAAMLDDGVPGSRTLLALPGFDEFLLGYQDRSLVLPPEHAQKVVPGGNGVFKRMIVSGGRVVGTWSREGTGKGTAVVPEPFEGTLGPAAQRSFELQAAKYLGFLGR
ncbi:winged helix DNA-binding domain-containing protein [Arthrobacter sp. CJ23]|uniref:winged helix DNA-binding domain-containing protein n=1 Tax=Arthrobacter sp. CJ23 TaxID=2972479 RepID=UPI00215BA350|nr:winged helix DNA-binding domain-containing protein [Arthrobacter sp. CJ23]UVJ38608.1 winged helix DNA-binding domain-containing protein [Arthrobacter sp. CJ23]